jgi:hypothetical protein
MSGSDIVNLVGLGIGSIGAILLAYDVIYRPGAVFQAEVIKTKLENLKRLRAYIRGNTERLPCPPYTQQEISRLLDEEEKKWGPEESALAGQNQTFLDKYESRVVNLGATGVCLIVLSFILQFTAVLIHHPGD